MEDNLVKNEEEIPQAAFEEVQNGGIDLPKIPEEEGIDDSGISDSKLKFQINYPVVSRIVILLFKFLKNYHFRGIFCVILHEIKDVSN